MGDPNIYAAVLTALALTLAPLGVRAELAPPPDDEQPPEPVPVEPEPIEVESPEPIEVEPPETDPLEAEPPEPEPIEIVPPEAAPEVPPPTAEPTEAPPEAPPEPTVEELIPQMFRDPTPEERARGRNLRRAGFWVMGTGGVLALTGFGLTVAYTVVGDRREAVADPILAEVEQADRVAKAGGILLASGIAVATIGGIIYTRGQRQLEPRPLAPVVRLRVAPAFGGLVVSGQF